MAPNKATSANPYGTLSLVGKMSKNGDPNTKMERPPARAKTNRPNLAQILASAISDEGDRGDTTGTVPEDVPDESTNPPFA
jgi:hypothetical protein